MPSYPGDMDPDPGTDRARHFEGAERLYRQSEVDALCQRLAAADPTGQVSEIAELRRRVEQAETLRDEAVRQAQEEQSRALMWGNHALESQKAARRIEAERKQMEAERDSALEQQNKGAEAWLKLNAKYEQAAADLATLRAEFVPAVRALQRWLYWHERGMESKQAATEVWRKGEIPKAVGAAREVLASPLARAVVKSKGEIDESA